MKETHPVDHIPPAPPPPPIGDKAESGEKKKDLELEGGEAPMDMDTKDEPENSNSSNTPGGDIHCILTFIGCECDHVHGSPDCNVTLAYH
jgi:hypothetical protein